MHLSFWPLRVGVTVALAWGAAVHADATPTIPLARFHLANAQDHNPRMSLLEQRGEQPIARLHLSIANELRLQAFRQRDMSSPRAPRVPGPRHCCSCTAPVGTVPGMSASAAMTIHGSRRNVAGSCWRNGPTAMAVRRHPGGVRDPRSTAQDPHWTGTGTRNRTRPPFRRR